MFILVYFYMAVLIKYIISPFADNFLFELVKDDLVVLFIIVINSLFHVILTRNNLN